MFEENYVIVDLETTGLSPINNEIIEIGAIKVKDHQIIDRLDILVKPENQVSPFITRLTGITNDMLKDAMEIKDALRKFMDFTGSSTLMAHNANFDMGFLRNNFQKHFEYTLENKCLDTLALSRKYVKGIKNYKLETLANHFHVNYSGAHRSLKDCEITYEVYQNIKEIYNKNTSID
ncbi:MAG: 3'-5' exonuclease [Clostridia bacterium]|nr:3'-5' exonuclease [Clostridia bacterium]